MIVENANLMNTETPLTNDSAQASELELDEQSIGAKDLTIGTLMRELNLQKRLFRLLCLLMDALEKKRQGKGMGWSRPWNKTGLNVFRTHVQKPEEDQVCMEPLQSLLAHFSADIPAAENDFIEDLLVDPKLMAFTFYHNHDDKQGQYEGLTLSLGRRVPEDKTKRDRLDIILEDKRCKGAVDRKVDRIRIYVCSWDDYQKDKSHFLYENCHLNEGQQTVAQVLYEFSLGKYQEWKDIEDRQWKHWSSNYISYFGARTFIPVGTAFD